MKKIIKKLNNYRFTAAIVSIVSLIAGIVSLGLLFIYYYAGDTPKTNKKPRVPSFAALGVDGRIMGMVFFLACILVIILSIAIIYLLIPALKNKEKVSPKKSPLILAVVNGGFQVVVLVFSILAIVLETPNTLALYILTIPFTALTLIANFLVLIPLLKCVFYMPSIKLAEVNKEAK